MRSNRPRLRPGIGAALVAATLFGAGTPIAKQLLAGVGPWMLAGLLYLGSGLGLTVLRRVRRAPPLRLPRREKLWLAGAVFAGGGVAPVLLMIGLARMPAAEASLLLNAEAVFTALLAWFAFRENVDRRVAAGMFAIVAAAALLSWPGAAPLGGAWPALAVLGACLAWALDNNLTRKVALHDATAIAAVKGLGAGSVNLGIALALGATPPPLPVLAGALGLGFAAYGVSLALFVVALRQLGTARTGAYFSVAPFFGALLALLWLGESPSAPLLGAAALMALGVWLHLSERHVHEHLHEAVEHEHEHEHDAHHAHAHREAQTPAPHSHLHRHDALRHSHAHFPDAHHRHRH